MLEVGRGAKYASAIKKAPPLRSIQLLPASKCSSKFTDISAQAVLPLEDRDESYSLTITAEGRGSIAACNALGLFRGLTTFEQLVYTFPGAGKVKYIRNAPIVIQDSPAFVSGSNTRFAV